MQLKYTLFSSISMLAPDGKGGSDACFNLLGNPDEEYGDSAFHLLPVLIVSLSNSFSSASPCSTSLIFCSCSFSFV